MTRSANLKSDKEEVRDENEQKPKTAQRELQKVRVDGIKLK